MTNVIFTSTPAKCYVYLNGVKIGTAPFQKYIKSGSANIEFRKAGYKSIMKKFVIFSSAIIPHQPIHMILTKSTVPPPVYKPPEKDEEDVFKVKVISAKASGKEKLQVDFTVENDGNKKDKYYIIIYHVGKPQFEYDNWTSYCDPKERDNERFKNVPNPYPDKINYKIKSKKTNKFIKIGTIRTPKIALPEDEIKEDLPSWITVEESSIPSVKSYSVRSDQGTIIIQSEPNRQGSLKIDNKNAKQNTPIALIGKEKLHKFELKIAVHEPRTWNAKFKKGVQRTFTVKMIEIPAPDPLKDWWAFIDHVGKIAMTFFPAKLNSFQNIDTGQSGVGMPLIIPIAQVAEDSAIADEYFRKMGTEGGKEFAKAFPTIYQNLKAVMPKVVLGMGAIMSVVGLHSFSEWIAKELPENIKFSLSDLIRNKQWEEAAKILPEYEKAVNIASTFMEKTGWLNPFLASIWESYASSGRADLEVKRKQIEDGLAMAPVVEEEEEPALLVFKVSGPEKFYVSNFPDVEMKYESAMIVDEGEYSGVISAEGYESKNYTQFINKGDTKIIDMTLTEIITKKLTTVSFKTNVDCEIEVEGYETKNTINQKASFDLFAGWYRAYFRKDEYKTKIFTFTIDEGEEQTFNITLEKVEVIVDEDPPFLEGEEPSIPPTAVEGKAKIKITIDQFGTVGIGDQKYEDTTDVNIEIEPGTYDIKASAEGYADEFRTVYLRAGDNAPVFINFSYKYPLAPVEEEEVEENNNLWRVDISSFPSGAKILIDSQFTGKWTPDYIVLLPGTYTVGVVKTGYLPEEEVITLDEVF